MPFPSRYLVAVLTGILAGMLVLLLPGTTLCVPVLALLAGGFTGYYTAQELRSRPHHTVLREGAFGGAVSGLVNALFYAVLFAYINGAGADAATVLGLILNLGLIEVISGTLAGVLIAYLVLRRRERDVE